MKDFFEIIESLLMGKPERIVANTPEEQLVKARKICDIAGMKDALEKGADPKTMFPCEIRELTELENGAVALVDVHVAAFLIVEKYQMPVKLKDNVSMNNVVVVHSEIWKKHRDFMVEPADKIVVHSYNYVQVKNGLCPYYSPAPIALSGCMMRPAPIYVKSIQEKNKQKIRE